MHTKWLIHDHLTAHELAAHLAEKKSLVDFCRIFLSQMMACSCSRDFESTLAVAVSAKEAAHQVCRRLVECMEAHAGILPGTCETLHTRALPGARSRFSPLKVATPGECRFELLHLGCDISRQSCTGHPRFSCTVGKAPDCGSGSQRAIQDS